MVNINMQTDLVSNVLQSSYTKEFIRQTTSAMDAMKS